MSDNCKATFRKDGNKTTVDAKSGETFLEIANENDIPMDNACGGNGVCTTCMIKVKDGDVSEMTEKEEMMGLDTESPEIRLGCQAKANGDCDVEIAY